MDEKSLKFSFADVKLIAICLLINAASILAVLLYTAALPQMAIDLNILPGKTQATLSVYYIGFGLALIFYGHLSDRFGRKPIILFALGILIIGSFLSLYAKSLTILYISKIIKGFGGAGAAYINLAIIRDHFKENKYKFAISIFTIGVSLLLTIPPILGGYIQQFFHWRFSFLLIFYYSVLAFFIALFFLPETNLNRIKKEHLLPKYREIIKSRKFWTYTIILFLTYSCFVFYLSITPFIFQKHLSMSFSKFNTVIILPNACFVIGSILNLKEQLKHRVNTLILFGLILGLIGGFSFFVFDSFFTLNIITAIIPLCILLFGQGFIYANAMAGALSVFPLIAGAAASFLGFVQVEGTGLLNGVTNLFNITTAKSMGLNIFIFYLIMILIFLFLMPRKKASVE